MFYKSFEDMGVPEGYGYKHLLFHAAAAMLVAQVEAVGKWLPERLYCRRVDEERYQPVGAPAAMMTQECPVIAAEKPLLAYNTMQCRYSTDAAGEKRLSGDWDSLKIYDLATRELVQSISAQTLHVPTGITDCWIASIYGFGRVDEVLYVNAAISRNKGVSMEYHLACLDVANRSLQLIALLPAVFI